MTAEKNGCYKETNRTMSITFYNYLDKEQFLLGIFECAIIPVRAKNVSREATREDKRHTGTMVFCCCFCFLRETIFTRA